MCERVSLRLKQLKLKAYILCSSEISICYCFDYIFLLYCTFVRNMPCSVNIIIAATIPYKFILNTKFSKRCNSCPGCPNNTKFCSQTDLSMKILILSSISAEYADKRWIKITRIKELTETVTPCWFVFY